MIDSIKKNKIIILILLAAFLLRIGALNYGLPGFAAFGDEIVHIAAGFNLLAQKTLRANFDFYYVPPLMAYLLAPIFALMGVFGVLIGKFQGLADYQSFVILNKEYFLIVSRIISAVLGTAAVGFIFLLAKKFFNSDKIALISAIFMAFDFMSVHESQIGRFWMPLTFFMLGAAYFIYRIHKDGDLKWYLLSGLMLGLGFGIGYAAIMLVLWFLIAHLSRKEKIFNKKFILGGGSIFFLIILFIYFNTVAFVRQFGHIIFTIGSFFGKELIFSPIDVSSQVQSNYFYFKLMLGFLWNNNPLFFIFGIFGFLAIFFSKKTDKFSKFFLIGAPLVYLFIITFLFSGIEGRYVLPAMPFFILGTSYAAAIISERLFVKSKKWQNIVLVFLGGIFCFYSVYLTVSYTRKLQKPDTRVQAREWIYQNIKPESLIIVADKHLELNENKESILFLKENNPSRLDVKRKYLLALDESGYPEPKYNVLNPGRIDFSKVNLENISPDYVVFSFWEEGDKKDIDFFPYDKELVRKFYPQENVSDLNNILNEPATRPFKTLRGINYLGPYVEIYKIK